MLQHPTFDNRALNQSFYQALINHFHDSLNLSIQSPLEECRYGMAPSPTGIMTFMIVAPSRMIAEQLLEDLDIILQRVSRLMAGVGQVAVCIAPPQEGIERSDSSRKSERCGNQPPRQMACKIFTVPGDIDSVSA